MWQYNSLYHGGKKGMKWGYNDGSKNGNRTAEDKELQKYKEEKAKERGNAEIEAAKKKRQNEIDALKSQKQQAQNDKLDPKDKEKLEMAKKAADNVNFRNNPPENYNPKLTKTTRGGEPGYVNARGEFFSSKSVESIKLQSWRADVAESDRKAKKAASEAPSEFENAINSGKKKVEDILSRIFK